MISNPVDNSIKMTRTSAAYIGYHIRFHIDSYTTHMVGLQCFYRVSILIGLQKYGTDFFRRKIFKPVHWIHQPKSFFRRRNFSTRKIFDQENFRHGAFYEKIFDQNNLN
jgi:hypothetical protein